MYSRPPDFEAEVRFLLPEEGGRSAHSGAVRQGYRCDIHWDDDQSDVIWMIWPMFLDEAGRELPDGAVIPYTSRAHFYISSDAA